ncbi:extracellular solute-binding protein [Pseudoroseicyclus sp. H15]
MSHRLTQPRLAASLIALVAAGAPALAQDSTVTRDRVGPADAEKSLTFRLTAYDLYSADPATKEGYEALFTDFIEAHPGWRIDTELMTGDSAQEQARILEQARAGRGPDCAMVDSPNVAAFIEAGVLTPITSYLTDEEVSDMFPFAREGVTGPDGELYAWWWFTSLQVLYRNTELVPEAPQTWAEVKEAALAAADEGYEGILFNGGRTEGTTFDWLPNFWAQGGKLFDETGRPVFGEGENREKFLAALEYYDDLVESGAAPARVSTITDYEEFFAAAAAQTAAMFIGGNWQYAQINARLPEDIAAKWEVSAYPGPTEDQRATGSGGWTIAALTDDPEKIEMCMDIARLYAGPGNAFQNQLPTLASYYDEYEVYQAPEYQLFAESLQDGVARPAVALYPEVTSLIQVAMGEVLSQAKEPEAALDEAYQGALAAYDAQ